MILLHVALLHVLHVALLSAHSGAIVF
uniref:Uncharacterized protein n=1 Tax=Arundo donax TaxID=35708 RepID=A0A0A9GME5_ARUDO